MVSQCQNPDEDLTLKSYCRDNISKASDLTQNIIHSKHSVNMNSPFFLFPYDSWLLARTQHLPISTSKANINEYRDIETLEC